jgi:hypothetical protein
MIGNGLGQERLGPGFGSCLGRRRVGLCLALVALLPFAGRAEKLRSVEARDVTMGIYSDDSSALVATLKVARVFNENRRLGFFRVKLLPVLVVQGVRLEFTESTPNTNWPAGFRANPAPLARPGTSLEWRDVSVRFPQDTHPRLQAGQLHPPTGTDAESCLLEHVTLQTDAGALNVARARLLLKGLAGRLVWESQGVIQQWDLFTRSLISEKSKS